jgi:hypothetical protein
LAKHFQGIGRAKMVPISKFQHVKANEAELVVIEMIASGKPWTAGECLEWCVAGEAIVNTLLNTRELSISILIL